MHRSFISFLLIMHAFAASAGTSYQLTSTTTGTVSSTLAGEVKVEGSSMRMDVRRGDGMLFRNGSIVLSRDGGRTLAVYDPAKRTFYELSLDQLVASTGAAMKVGGMEIEVRDPKVKVIDAGAGGVLEALSTRRVRVESSYTVDLGVAVMQVATTSESWLTDRLPASLASFLQQTAALTGIPSVDKLLAAQTAAMKGFPLKQVTTMRIGTGGRTITSVTTTTVTAIRNRVIPAAELAAPVGYRKVASPLFGLAGVRN
jgi:hypothetical protein